MPKASIIVRTKNEERWIKHCLKMVHAQSLDDLEIILVDNQSEDATVKIAQREGVDSIVNVAKFRPGDALNQGIAASSGDYIVCLSAHCIPRDENWLKALIDGFENERVAGVYGRQIPVSFSSDNDKRDLLLTFGLDRRVQIKDHFFHNANSVIRRNIWERYPFDAEATNIEDRIWAKEVISEGYCLVYEPEAAVHHYHGIHQNLDAKRARSIISILEEVEPEDSIGGLPETMKPENAHVTAICPVLGDLQSHEGQDLLLGLVGQLRSSKFVSSIILLSENPAVGREAEQLGVGFIQRPDFLYSPEKTIEDVLQYALEEIEERGEYPDAILYANYLFPNRPQGFFDQLVEDLQVKGLDTVFAGLPDYDNYWMGSEDDGFQIIGDGMKPRAVKRPLYKALYGLGTVASPSQIRAGTLVGASIGIIAIHDPRFAYKISPPSATVGAPSL